MPDLIILGPARLHATNPKRKCCVEYEMSERERVNVGENWADLLLLLISESSKPSAGIRNGKH